MKIASIDFGLNVLQLEKKMSDWFMDFFNEQENIDNTQQMKRLFLLLERLDLLILLLQFIINKTEVINEKVAQFTFVNTTVKTKESVFTNVNNNDNKSFFYKEKFLMIANSIFLLIFAKIFYVWNYKQLII